MVSISYLTHKIGSAGPSWISVSNSTLTIAPTVGANVNITVIGKDGASNSINTTFNVFIFQNTPPSVVNATGNYSVIDNTSFTYTVNLSQVFSDINSNQTLVYNYANVPSYLTKSLTGSIFTMSGTPNESNVGQTNITFRCSDG